MDVDAATDTVECERCGDAVEVGVPGGERCADCGAYYCHLCVDDLASQQLLDEPECPGCEIRLVA
jgi:DNA-directed RNA polymerase subunit RPC12/RpoP